MKNDISITLSDIVIVPKSNFYYLENISFDSGTIVFLLNSFENHQIKITFSDYYAFRVVDESLLLDYFNDNHLNHSDGVYIYVLDNTPFFNDIKATSINFFTENSEMPVQYGIFYLSDEWIEVISKTKPTVEYD